MIEHIVTVQIRVRSGGITDPDPIDWEEHYKKIQTRGIHLTKKGAKDFVELELNELFYNRNGPDVIACDVLRVKSVK